MVNAQYKLIAPRLVETCFTDLRVDDGSILVRPNHLSICKADIRYFFGLRDAKVLKSKLPLALVHEAVGKVMYDPSGKLKKGDTVVLLPNIPGDTERCNENYSFGFDIPLQQSRWIYAGDDVYPGKPGAEIYKYS